VPHPFSAFTKGMRKHAIMRVHNSTDPLVYWDALEGYNPSTAGRYGRAATIRLAAELGLPLVGNSDGHTLDTIGDGRTHFPGSTAEDYRRAILKDHERLLRRLGLRARGLIYTARSASRPATCRAGAAGTSCATTSRAISASRGSAALQRQREAEYLAPRSHSAPPGRRGPRGAEEPSA
jgi:hypothetical protein